jgi:nicotinate-nucleotide adenylyltransferase
MRLGLCGGTFDPVHYGHLLLAEQCREQCRLNEVRFIPSGNPPHKESADITSGQLRAEMLELAVAGHPQFAVDSRELNRDGITYTVDTLSELAAEEPERELFFLIGADSLHDLPTWREPQRIAELATIIAVNRGDCPLPSLDEIRETLGEAVASRIEIVTMPGIDLSATDIRRRIQSDQSIRFMTPRAVEVFVAENGLYRG